MTQPSFADMFRVFGRIGVLSFGGPAAQIALMHRELVEERPWLDEDTYLRALSLCMLLPGPEAMQLATYAGWRLRGVPGGLLAGGLFVIPGALVIFALAAIYLSVGNVPLVQALFLGIKAAVIAIVVQALLRLGKKALDGPVAWAIALASFIAIFALGLPFPLILLAAAIAGALLMYDPGATHAAPAHRQSHWGPVLAMATLWAAPLALVAAIDPDFLLPLGLFFSELAVVSFGGAYALLAYMTQTVVSDYGWIGTTQMIDALGLAETTPGPLILVTQFVAVLAGAGQGGWGMGLIAGLLALWVTFVPCFLWIFAAAPHLEALTARPRLNAALKGITAAVVGVIANLSLWFGLHVLFGDVSTWGAMPVPVWSSFNLISATLAILAGVLLIGRGWSVLQMLGVVAFAGLGAGLIFG